MNGTPSIWTIVVTYNAESVIGACLSSLEASTFPTRVLVVDNGSEDGTVEVVKRDFPKVTVDEGFNLGFAGGCNRGVRLTGQDATAYFFLNPDAEVSTTCIERLVLALNSDDQLAVVSPTLRNPISGRVEYAGALNDFENLDFRIRGYGDVELGSLQSTIYTGRPTGAAMLVRRSSLDDVGLMDATYFLYWEECEWAWRFRRGGFEIGYVPSATVLHSASHSTGGSGSKIYEYYYTRNLLIMVSKVNNLSKRATVRQLLPLLFNRLWITASRRKVRPLATTTYFDILGIVDFIRGRQGPRSGLPDIAEHHSHRE